MLRLTLCALAAALSTAACSTPSGRTSALTIFTEPATATVHDGSGRVLGTTPWTTPATARDYSEYLLSAPGYDTTLVTVGTAPPGLGGGPRLHTHTVAASALGPGPVLARVQMQPTAPQPDTARLSDTEAAVVFAAFADGAVAAGCEPLLANAWRDAALLLAGGAPPPAGADTLREAAAAEVARAAPRLRELCARRTPRMERLREIRLRLERPPETEAEATPYAPVYFDSGSYQVPDSVRERLRGLGRALGAAPMAVTLVVEGFTDGSDDERLRELGFQRARAVIAELRAGGLPADCCLLTSGGVAEDAGVAGGRWSRRATFSLDYRGGAR
ncbi:MAG TPA: hypothetical protein VEW03_03005 [Longimicrobiaceae bacterium]|nr:hypothetical protein [Longimicrobiaceae bacterium]